jgi:histidine ammonia-lyase
MGTTAARHAAMIINNSRNVLAIEAICAAQVADIRGVEKLAPKTKKLYLPSDIKCNYHKKFGQLLKLILKKLYCLAVGG